MNRRRIFQVVVILAAILAYLTIVIGGDVRSTESGMACGASWPFCSGGIIPNLSSPGVAIEFTHRVVAFATSLLVLATLILALWWYRAVRAILYLSVASMVLLVAQVLLGMLTVQSDLDPTVVTAHMALGTATFAAALILAVVALMPSWGKPTAASTPG